MLHRILKLANLALAPLHVRVVHAPRPPLSLRHTRFAIANFEFRYEAVSGVVRGSLSPHPPGHLSVLEDDLGAVIDTDRFRGARVLEIGPKYGYHSRWIDQHLEPSYLGLIDLADDIDHGYVDELRAPHDLHWDNVLTTTVYDNAEPFDLIVCTGVLYHTVEQVRLLAKLWTLAREDAMLVLETTVSPLGDDLPASHPVLELRWHGTRAGSYLLPSRSAVLTMLAMTGWNDVRWFLDFATVPSAMLVTARRSQTRASTVHGVFGLT